MARFTGIPSLPPAGLDPAQARLLSAIKENVELLTGTRGEQDRASRALTRGQVNIRNLPEAQFRNLTARGDGIALSGAEMPTLQDYTRALQDIQRLSQDVDTLREYVQTLITQLRG